MAGIDKQASPFAGRSRSFTVLRGRCGLGDVPQPRLDAVPVAPGVRDGRTIGGKRLVVEKYRCRCLTGREIRRELAA